MNRVMRFSAAVLLGLLLPSLAMGDHSCIDERPYGQHIERAFRMPKAWLQIGGHSIEDPRTHEAVKRSWPAQYEKGWDEGEFGYVCLARDETYTSIGTNGFGVNATFSRKPPACDTCNDVPTGAKPTYPSGTGLVLGMSKAQVSDVLKTRVYSDIATITFEERILEKGMRVIRTESLGLNFEDGRLLRYDINVFREPE
jgi:hypothetical protein